MVFKLGNWIKGDKQVEQKQVKFAEAKNVEVVYENQRAGSCLAEAILAVPVKVGVKKSFEATLLSAASLGDEQAMERLIRRSSSVNVANSKAWTPLMYASQRGNHGACLMLLRCGAVLDAQNDKGRTALMLAVSWGHSRTAEYLLQHFFSTNSSVDVARRVFSYVNMRDNEGKTALHHAVLVNHLTCVIVLLKNRADPEVVDRENRSPLSIAKQFSESGRSDAYKELLKYKKK
uniref:Uncharacterized protein n=1 Tax=Ditylenchus dipsaci TaxID=166011 RepID=A0A915D4W8_9BILA